MSAKAGPSSAGAGGSKPRRQPAVKQAPPLASSSDDSGSGSETDSSEDVTEDEDGVDLTPALDAAILRTLAKIRDKRGVYEGENVLADELKQAEEKVIKAGIKAMPNRRDEIKKYTLADHHRAALLNGKAGAEDEGEEEEKPLTHAQSQYKLRNDAVSAFKALADGDSDDEADGDLLTRREKDDEEADEDDEEYRRFLLEMGGGEAEVRKILGMGEHAVPAVRLDEDETQRTDNVGEGGPEASEKEMRKQKKKAAKRQERKAKEDDDFLMNYILNRGWIDRSEEHVPTYDEIVGRPRRAAGLVVKTEDGDDEAPTAGPSHPWGELDEEDDFDEKAEEFENAYNFRFEEPGANEILTHPREIPSLVRRTDDTRATKRAAKAERKAAEKAAKEEEARRIKGEKRREMEKQMASLRKDLGIQESAEGEVDWDELEKVMDGDFDEAEWERVVGKMLEAQRDKEDEDEDEGDEKPEWDDDVVEIDYEDADDGDVAMHMSFGGGEGAAEGEDEEGPINMDADFADDTAGPSKKRRRKDKKGKSKADPRAEQQQADQADADAAEEEGLTVAEKAKRVKKAMDEYKALDHEDMIGDMPTRFKYTKSKSTAFGLTPAEILLATDKELDAIAGLKHIAPYRKHGLGMQGRGISKRIYDLKQKLKLRKWGEEVDDSATAARGGKERQRERDSGWNNSRAGAVAGQKRKADTPGDQVEVQRDASGKKKRMGKKQRQKAAAAAAAAAQAGDTAPATTTAAPNGNRYEGMDQQTQSAQPSDAAMGQEGGKAKRRKKKGGDKKKPEDLQIFD